MRKGSPAWVYMDAAMRLRIRLQTPARSNSVRMVAWICARPLLMRSRATLIGSTYMRISSSMPAATLSASVARGSVIWSEFESVSSSTSKMVLGSRGFTPTCSRAAISCSSASSRPMSASASIHRTRAQSRVKRTCDVTGVRVPADAVASRSRTPMFTNSPFTTSGT